MNRFLSSLAIFASLTAHSQKQPSHTVVTGNCNGTAVGTNITITVKCEDGITKEQAQQLADEYAGLLKTVKGQIKSENLNFQDAIARLKDIQGKLSDLEAMQKGRRLTKDQIYALSQAVAGFEIPSDNFQYIYATDAESIAYSNNFREGLHLPPKSKGVIGRIMTPTPRTGISLGISSTDYANRIAPPLCEAIANFLIAQKIPYQPVNADDIKPGHCQLEINSKPFGY